MVTGELHFLTTNATVVYLEVSHKSGGGIGWIRYRLRLPPVLPPCLFLPPLGLCGTQFENSWLISQLIILCGKLNAELEKILIYMLEKL